MNLQTYPDRDLMMLALADRIAGALGDFLRREGRASLCLPGGATPLPVFDILSGVDLDWGRVTVLPGDERWLPEDDPRSNGGRIRRRMLTGRAVGAAFLPLYRAGLTPQEAAPVVAADLAPLLPLSVVLLGMGADGHVASLFPGGGGIGADAPAVLAVPAGPAPEPRLTLSAPVLAGAMEVHLLIAGTAKRAALERAAGLPPEAAPVRAILDDATVHWAEQE